MYKVLLDAELSKAFDVWSGYLNARTGEDDQVRARLRSTLHSARAAAAEGDPASARALVAEMYDDAREAGLPWAPVRPGPCAADRQARDYAKDELRQVLPVQLREDLDSIALYLRVTGRRLQTAPGLDATTRQDILYISARAGMALDLAHPTAARRELERLKAIARRCGVEP
ncbi:hypothetical protein NFX46_18900 [Streptomyces phaeoluteigriseus]|uniref:RsbT co-antagonist protein RsbRD N-terminal domain-containing protein n=1 Tax=Streptomyces phaeoluteigriseus TaxID=114686 RepID=A0ABY4Z9J3_9ACTN|nr:hypothetical protein [Streptomyces phaeoluteigriseus]USQ85646.1 hypothetical protein NFX46_18900 [Streptomyces phaeoluteigriseus]